MAGWENWRARFDRNWGGKIWVSRISTGIDLSDKGHHFPIPIFHVSNGEDQFFVEFLRFSAEST